MVSQRSLDSTGWSFSAVNWIADVHSLLVPRAVLLLQKDGQFAVIDSLANSAFLKKGALLARAFASAMSFPSSPQLAFSPKDLPQLQLNSYDCGPTVAAVVAEFVSIPPSEDTLKKGFALVSKESHTFQRKAQKWRTAAAAAIKTD